MLRASKANNFAPTAWKLFLGFPEFKGELLPELPERDTITCPDCNGTGVDEDECRKYDCERCDKLGTIEKLVRVKIGGFDYDVRYLAMMRDLLPNVRVNPTKDYRQPMAFKFDGGGEGFLHGLKPEGIAREDA